jgi:glycosyltransferase involved in cell wall biosynthesis
MQNQIKVSVCMITYNHDKYIEKAIASVLAQKTSFKFELIIGNDASPDTTDLIVKKMIRENKNELCEIVYVLHEKNVGMGRNSSSIFDKARGQYMALCEGDDFWSDPLKLQKQVEALTRTPSATLCFHAVSVVDGQGAHLYDQHLSPEIVPSFKALMQGNIMHTPSVMYRIMFRPLILDWMIGLPVGDWITHLRHAERGEIIYLDQVMATYRIHAGGVWSMIDERARALKWIEVVDAVIENLFPQFRHGLNYTKKVCLLKLSVSHLKSFQIAKAFDYLVEALRLKTDPSMNLMFFAKKILGKLKKIFLKIFSRARA